MKQHASLKINWIGFPDTFFRVQGVYLINDFYVGASKHIRSRILNHIHVSLDLYNNKTKLQNMIEDAYYRDGFITVTLLDKNPYNEFQYIEKLNPVANSKTNGRFYHQNKAWL